MKVELQKIENSELDQLLKLGFHDDPNSGNYENPSIDLALLFIEKKFNLYVQTPLDQTLTPKFCLEIYHYHDHDFKKVDIDGSDWGLYRNKEDAKTTGLQYALKYLAKWNKR